MNLRLHKKYHYVIILHIVIILAKPQDLTKGQILKPKQGICVSDPWKMLHYGSVRTVKLTMLTTMQQVIVIFLLILRKKMQNNSLSQTVCLLNQSLSQ